MIRVRYKLNVAGKVAFIRVEDESVPTRHGWRDTPADVPLFAVPGALAAAHGFDNQNTLRRLLVELSRFPEFVDELERHSRQC